MNNLFFLFVFNQVTGDCPRGFVDVRERYSDSQYGDCIKVLPLGTFEEAKTRCECLGGHLARMESKKMNLAIASQAPNIKNVFERMWIGYSDEGQEGVWLDSAGNVPKYSRWGTGLPDNSKRGDEDQDCVVINYGMRTLWDDEWCSEVHIAACQTARCEPGNCPVDICVDLTTVPCDNGYEVDNIECKDIDECATGNHNCNLDAVCTNTDGTFTCDCLDGYAGNGITCTDVNECFNGDAKCDALATCSNTKGAFVCTCPAGYSGDGMTCTDNNECSIGSNTCDSLATCTNENGGYTCVCPEGYSGDGFTCTETNECATTAHNCHPAASCQNTVGSFTCSCTDGHTGDGIICDDNDECVDGTHNCDTAAICTNSVGTFSCACPNGYEGDGRICTDNDECGRNGDNCHRLATCSNIAGGFECYCPVEYTGDGVTCTLKPVSHGPCPAGFTEIREGKSASVNGDCIQVLPSATYDEAEHICATFGGHLARSENKEMNVLLSSQASFTMGMSSLQYDVMWIGYTDRVTATQWRDSDGQPPGFYNFGTSSTGGPLPDKISRIGEDGKEEKQSCLVTNYRMANRWDDDWCSEKYIAACQIDRCPLGGCPLPCVGDANCWDYDSETDTCSLKNIESSKCTTVNCGYDQMSIFFVSGLFGKAGSAESGYPWAGETTFPNPSWDETLQQWQVDCDLGSCGMTISEILHDGKQKLMFTIRMAKDQKVLSIGDEQLQVTQGDELVLAWHCRYDQYLTLNSGGFAIRGGEEGNEHTGAGNLATGFTLHMFDHPDYTIETDLNNFMIGNDAFVEIGWSVESLQSSINFIVESCSVIMNNIEVHIVQDTCYSETLLAVLQKDATKINVSRHRFQFRVFAVDTMSSEQSGLLSCSIRLCRMEVCSQISHSYLCPNNIYNYSPTGAV